MLHAPQASFAESHNLEGHMALVRQQVELSLSDPETIQLARRIVNGVNDYVEHPVTGQRHPVITAWGERFWAPRLPVCGPKDDACELQALWTFLVENCRYVYDRDDADTFATLKQSLLAHGGDCDDAAIAFCALARAIGFSYCFARVISVDGGEWEHVYPLIGCPKDRPQFFVPLDITVEGVPPGWQVPNVAAARDFPMSG